MQALALNLHYLQLRQGERIEYLLARATLSDAQPTRHAPKRNAPPRSIW